MRSLTICFLGNFSVPYCSEVFYKHELEGLGHIVVPLQEGVVTTEEILSSAKQSDLFIWIHSHRTDIPGTLIMSDVLASLKLDGIPTMTYHLDLYLALPERKAEYENSSYFRDLDYFFTVDKLMAEWLNTNTHTKGVYLPAGIPTEQCYMDDYTPEFASDISFIGSYGYHKEWQWRPQLIDWLKSEYGGKFTHWGGDGKQLMRERNMNLAYASTKISIGDTLCIDFSYPYYTSDRLFNQTGAGAFTLCPYIRGIEDLFEIGKEVVTFKFGDFDDLKRKIDYYLEHPAERNDIRIAGYLRTKRDHTYRQRWLTILDTMGFIEA